MRWAIRRVLEAEEAVQVAVERSSSRGMESVLLGCRYSRLELRFWWWCSDCWRMGQCEGDVLS